MKTQHVSILILATVLWSLFITASPVPAEEAQRRELSSIAVMPFLRGEDPTDVEAVLNCSIDRFCPDKVDVAVGGEDVVTRLVWNAVQKQYPDRMVSLKRSRENFSRMQAFRETDTIRALAVRFGKYVNASHVVLGNIWRFREKAIDQGQPASVAFSVFLLDVATGRRMWRERYNQTQAPLSENLLKVGDFIKQGGRWLTASELAAVGVKDMMQRFPHRNESDGGLP